MDERTQRIIALREKGLSWQKIADQIETRVEYKFGIKQPATISVTRVRQIYNKAVEENADQ